MSALGRVRPHVGVRIKLEVALIWLNRRDGGHPKLRVGAVFAHELDAAY